ncbi:MAG: O-antigen ligase family protein [bacterium]
MLKKTGIILAGIALAVVIIHVFSQKYVSNISLLFIPLSAVLIIFFLFLKMKAEWILMFIILNIMIGSANLFEVSFLNFNRLMGAIIIGLFFVEFFILKNRRFNFSFQGVWILLFAMVIIFSTFFSVNLNISIETLRLYIRVFLLYFLITNIITSSQWIRKFIYLLLLGGAIITVFSIIDNYTYKKYRLPITDKLGITSTTPEMYEMMIRKRDPNRLYGALGYTKDANYFALILVTLFPLAFIFMDDKKKLIIIFCYISEVLIFLGIIFSLSRAAILALFIITILMIKRSLIPKKILIVTLMVIVISLPILSRRSLKRVYNFVLYPFNMKKTDSMDIRNISSRIDCIKAGIQMFFDYPFFGVGIGNYPYIYPKYAPSEAERTTRYAHNTYIQILTETGLIGFIFFIAGILLNFLALGRIKRLTIEKGDEFLYKVSNLLEISFVAFLIASFFVSAASVDIFWIIIAASTSLYIIANQNDIFLRDLI